MVAIRKVGETQTVRRWLCEAGEYWGDLARRTVDSFGGVDPDNRGGGAGGFPAPGFPGGGNGGEGGPGGGDDDGKGGDPPEPPADPKTTPKQQPTPAPTTAKQQPAPTQAPPKQQDPPPQQQPQPAPNKAPAPAPAAPAPAAPATRGAVAASSPDATPPASPPSDAGSDAQRDPQQQPGPAQGPAPTPGVGGVQAAVPNAVGASSGPVSVFAGGGGGDEGGGAGASAGAGGPVPMATIESTVASTWVSVDSRGETLTFTTEYTVATVVPEASLRGDEGDVQDADGGGAGATSTGGVFRAGVSTAGPTASGPSSSAIGVAAPPSNSTTGIIVGVVVGVLAFLALIVFLVLRWCAVRERKRQPMAEKPGPVARLKRSVRRFTMDPGDTGSPNGSIESLLTSPRRSRPPMSAAAAAAIAAAGGGARGQGARSNSSPPPYAGGFEEKYGASAMAEAVRRPSSTAARPLTGHSEGGRSRRSYTAFPPPTQVPSNILNAPAPVAHSGSSSPPPPVPPLPPMPPMPSMAQLRPTSSVPSVVAVAAAVPIPSPLRTSTLSMMTTTTAAVDQAQLSPLQEQHQQQQQQPDAPQLQAQHQQRASRILRPRATSSVMSISLAKRHSTGSIISRHSVATAISAHTQNNNEDGGASRLEGGGFGDVEPSPRRSSFSSVASSAVMSPSQLAWPMPPQTPPVSVAPSEDGRMTVHTGTGTGTSWTNNFPPPGSPAGSSTLSGYGGGGWAGGVSSVGGSSAGGSAFSFSRVPGGGARRTFVTGGGQGFSAAGARLGLGGRSTAPSPLAPGGATFHVEGNMTTVRIPIVRNGNGNGNGAPGGSKAKG